MRLDHLLSKEHWPAGGFSWLVQSRARTVKPAQSWVGSGVRDGARGWNADQFGWVLVLLLVRPASFGGWVGNVVGSGCSVVGTLLGPEGAGMVGWSSDRLVVAGLLLGRLLVRHTACTLCGVWWWVWCG